MSREGALSPGIASLPVLDAKTFTLVGLAGGMRRVPASRHSSAICCVCPLQVTWPLCGQVFFCLQSHDTQNCGALVLAHRELLIHVGVYALHTHTHICTHIHTIE